MGDIRNKRKYLLLGRYWRHDMNTLSEKGKVFIRAYYAIHIIGLTCLLLRKVGLR